MDLLKDEGATPLVSDADEGRARAAADRLGAKLVAPDDAFGTECDVFAPCATGPVLTGTIPRLRRRVIAGRANNQLGELEDARLLRDRGILYAPDFVINAGGVIHLAGYETLGWDDARMAARLAGLARPSPACSRRRTATASPPRRRPTGWRATDWPPGPRAADLQDSTRLRNPGSRASGTAR